MSGMVLFWAVTIPLSPTSHSSVDIKSNVFKRTYWCHQALRYSWSTVTWIDVKIYNKNHRRKLGKLYVSDQMLIKLMVL